MSTKSKVVPQPFTNKFGQVLNPGDEVVFIGSGYNKSVNIYKGTYKGVYASGALGVSQKVFHSGEEHTYMSVLPRKRAFKTDGLTVDQVIEYISAFV